jgi:hypothetical protein
VHVACPSWREGGGGRSGAGHAGPGGEAHAVAAAPAPPQPMPATSLVQRSIGVGYWDLTPFPLFPPLARRSNGAAGKAPRAHLPARASPGLQRHRASEPAPQGILANLNAERSGIFTPLPDVPDVPVAEVIAKRLAPPAQTNPKHQPPTSVACKAAPTQPCSLPAPPIWALVLVLRGTVTTGQAAQLAPPPKKTRTCGECDKVGKKTRA